MPILEVNDIHKKFGHLEVLKGVSFDLEKGEVLSLLGASGSGKTTLLRCLNFLETPTSGSFSVNGRELFNSNRQMSDTEKRNARLHFGLVFQQFNLFPQYNVMKNLTLAAELQLKDMCKANKIPKSEQKHELEKITSNAERILADVGLTEKKDYYPSQLSGGQQQRVAIARALMLSPDILCFDEPTSALDPELTGEVLNVIKELAAEDMTMVIVTHEMNFAKEVSDKIIFLKDGVIAVEGTPDYVFNHSHDEAMEKFVAAITNK